MKRRNEPYDHAAIEKVAHELYRRRNGDVPDSELIISNKQTDLPPDHYCQGCEWATIMPDRVMCPLAYGSCARMPETMNKLDPVAVHERIEKYNQKKGNANA